MAAPQPVAPAGQMCGLFAIDIAAFTDQRQDEYWSGTGTYRDFPERVLF